MKKKEWCIDAPWGRLAFVSWGVSSNKPVFLCHGRQDSAVTFELLVKLLPDDHYYVSIDLPGNGKSDSYAPGMPQWYVLIVVPAMKLAIDHLGWKTFDFIGHSMGTAIGDVYNFTWPGQIERVIHIDPIPSWKRTMAWHYNVAIRDRYEMHFKNYHMNFTVSPHALTYDEAVAVVQRGRRLTPEAAKLVTKRNLVPAGDDKYRLCWEQRAKWQVYQPLCKEYYIDLLATSRTPTLILEAREKMEEEHDDLVRYIQKKLLKLNPLNRWHVVDGHHDCHLCVPELVAPSVVSFLRMKVERGTMDKSVRKWWKSSL